MLLPIKYTYYNVPVCKSIGGATIHDTANAALQLLTDQPQVKCIYLCAGICNITKLTSSHRVVMRAESLNIVSTVNRLLGLYRDAITAINTMFPSVQVVVPTIYGVDLSKKWKGFGKHRHQDILNEIISLLNSNIVKLNTYNCVVCPRSDRYIHMRDSRNHTVKTKYQRLRDGTHPAPWTLHSIANNLGNAMLKNMSRPYTALERQVYRSKYPKGRYIPY